MGWNLKTTLLYVKSAPSIKMPKFGTKNVWLGYFWTGIWKGYSRIWYKDPPICLMAIFSEKAEVPKLGTKMPYLGIFVQEFEKNYFPVWNQHPQICLFAKLHEKI